MGSLKSYWVQASVIGIIFLLFFFTRIYNILNLPIFTDEALYIRWAQIAKQDASWRFISLVDGKQPSVIWMMMITLKFFKDPLLAGRMVSVFAGFLTTIGIFFLGRELFKNTWIGIISSFLYVLFPMGLVYDRMALYDSTVAMFTVWALFFEVLLVRKIRLDLALILGMICGGAVLTKTNGFFTLYLLPFSLLLFDWKQKDLKQKLLRWGIFAAVAAISAYGYYSILRLSPYFHVITEKNKIFVYPFSEWLKHPFEFFYGNLHALINWFLTYVTIPVFLFMIASFFILLWIKGKKKEGTYLGEKLLLLAWFIVPFILLAFFGNNIYPRFLLPMITPLLILAAYTLCILITHFKQNYVKIIIFLVAIVAFLRSDFYILTDIVHAPIADSDLGQYVADWPSGGGVKEAIQFLSKEAENKKIFVATQGTFGLMPHAFEMYLIKNPNITIEGVWPIDSTPPDDIIKMSKKMPTYFVFYQPCNSCSAKGIAPKSWDNLKQVYQYKKAAPDSFFTLYLVTP